jgi:cell shape-determining protein MreC
MEQLMVATNIIESNFSSIIKQRDELKRENYKLRQEIRHLKKKKTREDELQSPNKRNSFSNLFSKNGDENGSSTDDEHESAWIDSNFGPQRKRNGK